MTFGDLHDRTHLSALPEEMDGHDGASSRVDGLFNAIRGDVEGQRINIDEYRTGAQAGDSSGRREEAIWRGDNLIPATYAKRHQRKQESVRARGAADRV